MNPLAIDFLFALASCALTPAPPAADPTASRAQEPDPAVVPEDRALAEVRELLEAARRRQAEKGYAGARAGILVAIERAFARIGDREDALALTLFEELGRFAHHAGELEAAERARRAVLEVRARTLPEDHPDLQAARQNLAVTMCARGDLSGSHALFGVVLEVRARTLPEDHPDLQAARQNLAVTMAALGDLQGARALEETVLEVCVRTLAEDHPDLQRARLNLAATMYAQGDLHGARALSEAVLAVYARTLPDDHSDLQAARQSLGVMLYKLGDLRGARALFEAVLAVCARTLPSDHPELQRARQSLAAAIKAQGDLHGALALEEAVLEVRARTLPDEHPDLLAARQNLAATMKALGDLAGARALEEAVLEVRARTLPEDHPDLQTARQGLAVTIQALGDLAGARALEEEVLEVRARTLPDDHPDLQAARQNLAVTIKALGDLASARALEEKVLEVRARTLPDDHPDFQRARLNLAGTIKALGDLVDARALEEAVLEVFARTLPEDHPDLQRARLNLAGTIKALGDLASARALEEGVLGVSARTLPEDHPDLQTARQNLAVTMLAQGDLSGARALFENVLEVCARTQPEDHPDLQGARQNLAAVMYALGDLASARALFEGVLEVRARTLPEDHPDFQTARLNLAATTAELGDLSGARALFEGVLEVCARTLPADHPDLQRARLNLAATIAKLGDLHEARSLEEAVLEVCARTLPADHPDLQRARLNLAATMKTLGDLAGARALEEAVLDAFARTLPDDHFYLQAARQNLALTIMRQSARASREGAREQCAKLVGDISRSQVNAARAALLTSSVREAEERCARLAESLGTMLSFAEGYGVFEPLEEIERESFVLSETTRGAALSSASILRMAAGAPDYLRLRARLREASDSLAALAQRGATSEEYHRARTLREEIERELVALARELLGGELSGLDFDVDALRARLDERGAVVAFRRYTRWSIEADEPAEIAGEEAIIQDAIERPVESLCAFVVHGARAGLDGIPPLSIVDLGPLDAIEQAVGAWREALGVAGDSRGLGARAVPEASVFERGAELRRLAFDPLLPALGDADRVLVALDDVLHLVPFDALPTQDGALVGERWRIETRATLTELLSERAAPSGVGELVAIGDVAYGARLDGAVDATWADAAVHDANADFAPAQADAGILRGGAWSAGFADLPATGVEVRGIAESLRAEFGGGAPLEMLERTDATRERLFSLAPRARFLHVATHGWFAPESIQSWSDVGPLDVKSGPGLPLTPRGQMRGMSPMLLCGLALAGANLPEDELGRVPGLVTAEELSTLDLSNCELAVLSACDTNVGERRAGQGVASLQKALQMAGARSVITSLWKVPDEATKELMLDFYRRLWVERKPKHQALWEAKLRLRDARDANGEPLYSTRDWAAWVLTGEPF